MFIAAGLFHFINPDWYLDIMPDYLPFPRFLLGLTGMLEVLAGTGLLISDIRKHCYWILTSLLVIFLIIHIQHVKNEGYISEEFQIHPILAWGRLLFQFVLLGWLRWVR